MTVSWSPCDCAAAREAKARGGGMGHRTVRCGEAGCTSTWYAAPLGAWTGKQEREAVTCLTGSLPSMSSGLPAEPFRLWRRALPYARAIAAAILPVPDLVSRFRVRRTARGLITLKGKHWPEMDATGTDAMQLAMCRLLFLQRQTRRAVSSRQAEAATFMARAAIETLLTGLYCRYDSEAVSRLQAGLVKQLLPLMQFLVDAGVVPAEVLADCIKRLDLGTPRQGPRIDEMARAIDKATGAKDAMDLYNRYYRLTSTFAVHAGAASLLRHVNSDDVVTLRPKRIWTRRSPARIVDACTGILTAQLARLAGSPTPVADEYARRHLRRALAPVFVMTSPGFGRLLGPRSLRSTIAAVRDMGLYIWSRQDADDPAARTAHVRAGMSDLLLKGAPPDLALGALDPFLDFISADIVAATSPEAEVAAGNADTSGS